MTAHAVALDAVRPQPWRNGGGVTRELLAWPARGEWNVRVSVADIDADGPFSALPGVVRWFAVIEGAGVELAFATGVRRVLPADPPLRFDGVCHADHRRERVLAHTLLRFDVPPPVLRFAADVDTGAPVGWWLQWSARGAR